MEAEFWLKAWDEGRTGFHQEQVNKRLEHWWPTLGLATTAPVFVPLCGKSEDMLWLHGQGHPVLGVELSRKAVEAFYQEHALEHDITPLTDGITRFSGTGAAENLDILVGDIFELPGDALSQCQGIYDRASLIAMNEGLRARYARQLGRLMPAGSTGLLLAIDYDTRKMEGPPFAIPDAQVRTLLAPHFDIQELAHYSGPERLGNLKKRGLDTLDERVYRLQHH